MSPLDNQCLWRRHSIWYRNTTADPHTLMAGGLIPGRPEAGSEIADMEMETS